MDLKIVGNVQTILNGTVSSKTLFPFSLGQMLYALGGAAIPATNSISLGETMIYDGVGHIFTKEKNHIEHTSLNTAFLIVLQK